MESDSQEYLHQRLHQLKDRLSLASFYPCLEEEQLADFERRQGVNMPEAYRLFLLHIGNGGQGIPPLPTETSEKPSQEGNLQRDFPYLYPTPFPKFEEFVGWYKTNPKAVEQYVDVPRFRENYYASHRIDIENQLTLFNIKTFFEGEDFLEDLFEAYLYSPHHMDGTICLGEFDPGITHYLIVKGKRKGGVWMRSSDRISPLGEGGEFIDFLTWLENLL